MGYFEEHSEKYLISPGTKLCQVFGKTENANASVALVKMEKNAKGLLHYHDNITEIYFFSNQTGIININGIEHQVKAGECFVIPANNTHFIDAKENMNFMCVCIPPWTEEHEFVTREFISNIDIERHDEYGILFENEKLKVEYNKILANNIFEKTCELGGREVYYFAKGSGKIIIDGITKEIHEGEGFEILEGQNISIVPKDELIYMVVIDNF